MFHVPSIEIVEHEKKFALLVHTLWMVQGLIIVLFQRAADI